MLVLQPLIKSPFQAKFFGPWNVVRWMWENYLIGMPNEEVGQGLSCKFAETIFLHVIRTLLKIVFFWWLVLDWTKSCVAVWCYNPVSKVQKL